MFGLALYGMSISLMLKAKLGNQPWDVFHQGVARHTGLSVGTVLILTGGVVLLCWIPLRQRPGIGTISNMLVIGLVVDQVNRVLPEPSPLALRGLFLVTGIVLCGVASGLYIGANLGPGPRDGLMTGLARRAWSLRGWRTVLEITVVVIGGILGGKVGIGTIAYALSIGPLAQLFLPFFTVRPRLGGAHRSPAATAANTGRAHPTTALATGAAEIGAATANAQAKVAAAEA
jgi:uncharacterized membrane protein YczE